MASQKAILDFITPTVLHNQRGKKEIVSIGVRIWMKKAKLLLFMDELENISERWPHSAFPEWKPYSVFLFLLLHFWGYPNDCYRVIPFPLPFSSEDNPDVFTFHKSG